mgnify:CR=1 FL=1
MDMLKTMNDMIVNLEKGVSDDILDTYDSFYQTLNRESLTTIEIYSYDKLSELLWKAYAK